MEHLEVKSPNNVSVSPNIIERLMVETEKQRALRIKRVSEVNLAALSLGLDMKTAQNVAFLRWGYYWHEKFRG
jgi:hypothetical protein